MSEIKKENIKHYLEDQSTSLNTFRTLILFGKNVSTYKFAFTHSLLKQKAVDHLSYGELRDEFVKELVSHYQSNPYQYGQNKNKLTQAMDDYSQNQSQWSTLLEVADKAIYNNVFDAFQNVGGGTIDEKYRLFEHDKKNKRLILTDNVNSILEDKALIEALSTENQARWNVVEEAWKAGLSPNFLEYDEKTKTFESVSQHERVNLRSAVDVLAPYQKDRCFYCNRKVSKFVNTQDDDFADVDHVLPFSSMRVKDINPNGVWNLVIACKSCNRGEDGKFDTPPDKSYLLKLLDRNLLFIEEHKHSLRNSVMLSLNITSAEQLKTKMVMLYDQFKVIKGWKPKK